jgi:hypothetical protein
MKNYTIASPAIASVTHFRVGTALKTETGYKVQAKFGRETQGGAFNRRSEQWVELTEQEYKRVSANENAMVKLVAAKLELNLEEFEASLPDEDKVKSSDDSLANTKEKIATDIPPAGGESMAGADNTAKSAPKSSPSKGDTKPKSGGKSAKADVKPKSKAKG